MFSKITLGFILSSVLCLGKGTVVDNYHGILVEDPYRYLEDPNSLETQEWIAAQNGKTFGYLQQLPQREMIRRRLGEVCNFEAYGSVFKHAGRYFFSKNNGVQDQAVFYTVRQLGGDPEVVLDPNLLSSDGTVALTTVELSPDGKWFAYGLSRAGSDWMEIKVRDVETGQDLSDHLYWIKFSSIAWRGDGFYYARYDAPASDEAFHAVNYNHKLYFHKIGDSQEDDLLVYERPDHKEWMFMAHVAEDENYLIVSASEGAGSANAIFYKDLSSDGPFCELAASFDAGYFFVGSDGPLFWFLTTKDAPRGRLAAIDLNHPGSWREVIPEKEDLLGSVSLVGDRFIATYLRDAHSLVQIFTLDGAFEKTIDLPGLGTASGFFFYDEDGETFYSFSSYTQPPTIYRCDLQTGKSKALFVPKTAFSPDAYETRQIFFPSKDGTRVPMFLSYKKGLSLDGRNPTFLYGYGGFGISLVPQFSPLYFVWMEMGGVVAVPNLRGGGEYGELWHAAGALGSKQNVFDDFIAAADWLIANGITSSSKLAISGGSNGGLLVGACLTQRPDLFGAALPAVGVMDMLRFHKFTIGWGWVPEYGSPDDPEHFAWLYKYSPLHNLRPGTCYPPTLVTTADHDDRVVPAHSYKFAAALQEAQGCRCPILIRIDTSAGHGAGKPRSKALDELADKLAFLVEQLNMGETYEKNDCLQPAACLSADR